MQRPPVNAQDGTVTHKLRQILRKTDAGIRNGPGRGACLPNITILQVLHWQYFALRGIIP